MLDDCSVRGHLYRFTPHTELTLPWNIYRKFHIEIYTSGGVCEVAGKSIFTSDEYELQLWERSKIGDCDYGVSRKAKLVCTTFIILRNFIRTSEKPASEIRNGKSPGVEFFVEKHDGNAFGSAVDIENMFHSILHLSYPSQIARRSSKRWYIKLYTLKDSSLYSLNSTQVKILDAKNTYCKPDTPHHLSRMPVHSRSREKWWNGFCL